MQDQGLAALPRWGRECRRLTGVSPGHHRRPATRA